MAYLTYFLSICLEELVKAMKISVIIASLLTTIQTWDFQNFKQESQQLIHSVK